MAHNPIVTIEMEDGGVMKAELYPDVAPNTVNNFISLIQKGYYDGLIFHRVIPGFMIQGGGPGAHEVARRVEVGVHIGHDDEALFRENFSRAHSLAVVGQQILAVAHYLDFDKVAASALASEPRDAHRLVRRARARGVRQQRHALRDMLENAVGLGVCAAQRYRDNLRARLRDGGLDELRRIFARAENKARREFVSSDDEFVGHCGDTSFRRCPSAVCTELSVKLDF